MTNLQQKLQEATTTNALMKEDLAVAKNNFLTLQEENERLKNERDNITEEHSKQLEVVIYRKEQRCDLMMF